MKKGLRRRPQGAEGGVPGVDGIGALINGYG
jgi:hypothetical protein